MTFILPAVIFSQNSFITACIRDLIIHHHQQNLTQQQIAAIVLVDQSNISRIIKKWKQSGTVKTRRKHRCGRKRLFTSRGERVLARISSNNPKMTAKEVQREAGY